MFRWIIVAEVIAGAAAGAAACAVCRRGWPHDGSADAAPEGPFPVLWSDEPLRALADPRVKVCKSHLVMTVFDGAKPVKSYRVAVGAEPGHKQREGDRRTPEGELTVCIRNPHSKYVVSRGLSYPPEADAARGLRDGLISREEHDAIVAAARAGTQPPWNTALGGEIMIHGCRRRREHTLGCIAMDDAHIRELYGRLPVGTPVTLLP